MLVVIPQNLDFGPMDMTFKRGERWNKLLVIVRAIIVLSVFSSNL